MAPRVTGTRGPLGLPARSVVGVSAPFSPTGLGAHPAVSTREASWSGGEGRQHAPGGCGEGCGCHLTVEEAAEMFGQGYGNYRSNWPPYVEHQAVAHPWPPPYGYLGGPLGVPSENVRRLVGNAIQLFRAPEVYRETMKNLSDAAHDYRVARDVACDPMDEGIDAPWVVEGPAAKRACDPELAQEAAQMEVKRSETIAVYDAMNELAAGFESAGLDPFNEAAGLGLGPLLIAGIVGGVAGVVGGLTWIAFSRSAARAAKDAKAAMTTAAQAVRDARATCESMPDSPRCRKLIDKAEDALVAAQEAARETTRRAKEGPIPWKMILVGLGGIAIAQAFIRAKVR
jgi:hypothetical protein